LSNSGTGPRAAPNAVIFGCAGPALAPAERDFFRAANPLGFILFQRNCREPAETRRLVADLRASIGRADAPVLIDQEGGRVARLKPPHWRAAPPAARIAAIAKPGVPERLEAAAHAARLNARLIGAELADLGITVDCAPVLDVPQPGAHDIIGDRAYGSDPAVIAALGRAVCEGLLDAGVLPIVKHMPGHGRARTDSHVECPVVDAARTDLERIDFAPFRALADMPWAMTAHVVYTALDPNRPATVSPAVIGQVMRGQIGFDGLLVSDDLSMQALGGSLADRARAALAAGCDVVLHCNGKLAEMTEVAAATRALDRAGQARLARGEALRRRARAAVDVTEAAAEFDRLLATA
jgi:beta-N-acetylhexosaminidase